MDAFPRILRDFGFSLPSDETPESVYAYAPVFHAVDSRGEWIVKRTQSPLTRARAIASWVVALAAEGIRVVTPAAGFGENPRASCADDGSDEVWVVYPFISGDPYKGDLEQISAAGELLGAIHATRPTHDFGLKGSETVVAIEAAQIELDIEGILGQISAFSPGDRVDAEEALLGRREEYIRRALPMLLDARLPLANCVWDYKASNLIYPSSRTPVLVDPDSGGRIPRAYDLAIAALLFHNEGIGPGRLFNTGEWAAFLGGYGRHVRLTEEESQAWGSLLLCAWVDEALWLLREDSRGWSDPRQSRTLMSLLTTDLSTLDLLP